MKKYILQVTKKDIEGIRFKDPTILIHKVFKRLEKISQIDYDSIDELAKALDKAQCYFYHEYARPQDHKPETDKGIPVFYHITDPIRYQVTDNKKSQYLVGKIRVKGMID